MSPRNTGNVHRILTEKCMVKNNDNSGIVFLEIRCQSLLAKINFLPLISEAGMAFPYMINTHAAQSN